MLPAAKLTIVWNGIQFLFKTNKHAQRFKSDKTPLLDGLIVWRSDFGTEAIYLLIYL